MVILQFGILQWVGETSETGKDNKDLASWVRRKGLWLMSMTIRSRWRQRLSAQVTKKPRRLEPLLRIAL